MKAAAMAVLFLLVASSAVFPANVEIVLKDGYLLEGIAVELRGDVYYLQQARQGQLLVPAKLVREVRTFAPPDAAPGAVMPAPEPAESEVEPETESAAHEPVVTPDVSEPPPSPAVPSPFDVGLASWYGMPFHGKKTASGETFDMHALTAAHSTLPFGTLVRVTSLENGRHVNVRITDRVPRGQRVAINLSKAGAEELQMLDRGVARVRLSIVEQ
jgi:rare lipoprotein A